MPRRSRGARPSDIGPHEDCRARDRILLRTLHPGAGREATQSHHTQGQERDSADADNDEAGDEATHDGQASQERPIETDDAQGGHGHLPHERATNTEDNEARTTMCTNGDEQPCPQRRHTPGHKMHITERPRSGTPA